MNSIYFDESGNTGADLLNTEQPVFVLSSVLINNLESIRICNKHLSTEAQELHFTNLKKYKKYHGGVIGLLKDDFFSTSNVKIFSIHKRYMIVAKYLDLLLEPMLHRDGIDFLDGGMNIAHSNLHFMYLPVLCGHEATNVFYRSFLNMFRDRTIKSINIFYNSIEKLKENCKEEEFISELEILSLSQADTKENLSQTYTSELDPIIPSFTTLCHLWNNQINDKFRIVHDESKPLKKDKESIKILMNNNITKVNIGYGAKKFELPLKVDSFEFGDSKKIKQLQIADIFAGSYFLWLRGKCNGKYKDNFWNKLNETFNKNSMMVGTIWPSNNVGIIKDRVKQPGDINPIDYIANLFADDRKQ